MASLQEELKLKEREIQKLRQELLIKELDSKVSSEKLGELLIHYGLLEALQPNELRNTADMLRSKGNSVVFLASKNGNKLNFVIAVSRELSDSIDAKRLVEEIKPLIKGGGGGRPDMVQGGGSRPEGFGEAVSKLKEYISKVQKIDKK
jgi:alanyl-tRNA synthetase